MFCTPTTRFTIDRLCGQETYSSDTMDFFFDFGERAAVGIALSPHRVVVRNALSWLEVHQIEVGCTPSDGYKMATRVATCQQILHY